MTDIHNVTMKNGNRITIRSYFGGDIMIYDDPFTGQTRHAALRKCKWTRRLHGNAPSGTQYGSFRARIGKGEYVTIPVYI